MTDLAPAPEAPAAEAPAPAPALAPEAPGAPPPADPPAAPPSGAPDGDGDGEGDTFDRAYVEKLRDEAAKYRVTAKEREEALNRYSSAFEGADDQIVDAFLDMASLLGKDPKAGARELVSLARNLTGEEFESLLSDDDRPLTAAEVEARTTKLLEEREARQREKAALDAVLAEARELGYEDGTFDNAALFWFAHQQTDGDLKKADAALKQYRQSIIDSHIEQVKQANEGFPPVAGGKGEGPADPAASEGAKSWDEVRDRVTARLAASLTQ